MIIHVENEKHVKLTMLIIDDNDLPSLTLQDIKEKISKDCEIPVSDQILFFHDVLLVDEWKYDFHTKNNKDFVVTLKDISKPIESDNDDASSSYSQDDDIVVHNQEPPKKKKLKRKVYQQIEDNRASISVDKSQLNNPSHSQFDEGALQSPTKKQRNLSTSTAEESASSISGKLAPVPSKCCQHLPSMVVVSILIFLWFLVCSLMLVYGSTILHNAIVYSKHGSFEKCKILTVRKEVCSDNCDDRYYHRSKKCLNKFKYIYTAVSAGKCSSTVLRMHVSKTRKLCDAAPVKLHLNQTVPCHVLTCEHAEFSLVEDHPASADNVTLGVFMVIIGSLCTLSACCIFRYAKRKQRYEKQLSKNDEDDDDVHENKELYV